MNRLHHWICNSGRWRGHIARDLLPWAVGDLHLGDDVLEVGPGYGHVSDILRACVSRLTCVEVDHVLACALSRRMAGTNVTVIQADGVHLPLRAAAFSSVVCFTMLHHVPSQGKQDKLFAEVARVLRPGGIFAGTDSLPGVLFRLVHVGDTMTLVDPASLRQRLQNAGFADIHVEVRRHAFRFRATRRE